MTSPFELLEEIQEVYGTYYGLTFFLTDEKGNILVLPEGSNELCNLLLRQEDFFSLGIHNILKQVNYISEVFLHEMLPGLYVVAAPVKPSANSMYYLWGGFLRDEITPEVTERTLKEKYNIDLSNEKISMQLPKIIENNQEEWLHRTSQVAELATICLRRENTDSVSEFSTELFRNYKNTKPSEFSNLFSKILNYSTEIDFLGIAEQSGEELYEVSEVKGAGAESLNGISFTLGEGFLGRPLLTGESTHWQDVENDRRSRFFHPFSVKPKSLFCEPINRHDGSLSLVFGGSFSQKQISADAVILGKTLAVLIENNLLVHALRMENMHQLTRLTSLVDICKLMASTPDLRRILFILVDISINLVDGPFSCVVLKDKKNSKVQLVSRGDFNGQLETYVKDVVRRSHNLSAPPVPNLQEPYLHFLEKEEKVIECPLMHGDELLGILCVGVPLQNDSHLQEHLAFLQTLSIIGSVSLQQVSQSDSGLEAEKVEALHQAIAEFDPHAFELAEEAALLAAEFTTKIEMPANIAKDIIQACQLAYYSLNFLRGTFPGGNIVSIIEEGRSTGKGEYLINAEDLKTTSQIFALVDTYIQKNHSLEAVMHLKKAGEDMFNQFLSFVRSNHIIEKEFILADSFDDQEEYSLTEAVQKLKDLSPREKEVLALISEGKNNREIASQLYISDHTVKNHVTKIFQKMGVTDRANAISKVYRSFYNHS
ncbi:LuxR C-terminal-related transcriptional regulator [Planomicrobium sp. Y74]|uniref:LuxR C-terminal-related transcriptional regulator n=1 Tax=Planomicrobium sp. Y74 TaxID=2478977 RepID=UPI0018F4EF79|nr:LuxR C-terminal-related transcriptional regulator [Planomicrobium sp. Y74]